jgi:hypothetical protein
MSTDVLLLIREAADGMTSIELADAMRCSRRTSVHLLAALKVAGEIESTGEVRDRSAVFVVRTSPLQLALPAMARSVTALYRARRMFPGLYDAATVVT